jgi:hypothetical protein
MLRPIRRAGKIICVLVALSLSNVYAQDPPGGGGDTNGVPSTNNFVSQPFPLNLLTTCIMTNSVGALSSLSDLDSAVSAGYDQLTNSWMALYPPGFFVFSQDGGLFVFATNGEIAANIVLFEPTSALGVPLYKMGVVETQLTARSWVYMGASDGTNSVPFRTNAVPGGFDPEAWSRTVYDNPPAYLAGEDLAQWYSQRDRSRAVLGITLISEDALPALEAALDAARANATNSPGADPSVPVLPGDTNSLAFANVWSSPNMLNTWIYTPAARPVAVLGRTNLLGAATDWTIRGSFAATPQFNLWRTSIGSAQGFFKSGFVDQDSDGDGIPDFLETNITGTDPAKWDSAGLSLGDYQRFFIFGLSGTNRDSNADGMDDDEAILGGVDPNAWNTGASAGSIRYYYDADDRVSGAFAGSPAGAVVYKVSPAGNHASTAERSAP